MQAEFFFPLVLLSKSTKQRVPLGIAKGFHVYSRTFDKCLLFHAAQNAPVQNSKKRMKKRHLSLFTCIIIAVGTYSINILIQSGVHVCVCSPSWREYDNVAMGPEHAGPLGSKSWSAICEPILKILTFYLSAIQEYEQNSWFQSLFPTRQVISVI